MNNDIVTSATVVKADPQTIEYKINPGAVWSDGQPITADDFNYTWRVMDPAQCPDCQMANSAGYDSIESVDGSDSGKTVTVKFNKPYVAWQTLFSPFLPAHKAATYGDLKTKAGLATSFNDGFVKNVPDWSAGPFIIKTFTSDGSVVMDQNPHWFGAKKPNLKSLVFQLVSDPTQQAAAMANHEVDVLNPPNIDTDVVKQLAGIPDVGYQIAASFASHFMFLNMNAAALKDKAIRQAIFEAVNVQNIVTKILGPYVPDPKPLTSMFFLPGQDGYQDSLSKYSYGIGDVAAATKTLQEAGYQGVGSKLKAPDGTDLPPLTFAVSAGNQVRQNEA
ncbi:MAG: ABC transporter substrate-binding protein, partial [Nakamurella sp.]